MPDFLIWPAVALILGFVALLLFKPAIDRKIAGITRASKDGVSFERPQDGGEIRPPPLSLIEIMKHPISATALEREQTIEKIIQTSGLKTDAEKTSVLLRALSTTRIELEFNSIANLIFGSQLALLAKLVGTRNGVTRKEAESFFDQAQQTFPELHKDRTFDEWFAYLYSSNLATINDGQVDITQYGKDFLKHLVDARMAHNRYG